MSDDKGLERSLALAYSCVEEVGLDKPRPPKRVGKARRSLSSSVGGMQPVKEGMNSRWISDRSEEKHPLHHKSMDEAGESCTRFSLST